MTSVIRLLRSSFRCLATAWRHRDSKAPIASIGLCMGWQPLPNMGRLYTLEMVSQLCAHWAIGNIWLSRRAMVPLFFKEIDCASFYVPQCQ